MASEDRGNIDAPDAADLNTAARRYAASRGWAMSNGSYPIRPANMHGSADLAKAVQAVGRGSGSHDEIRRHIIKRARAIGEGDAIPDNWTSSGSMSQDEGEVLQMTLEDDGVWQFRVDKTSRRVAGLVMPWNVVATDSRGMGRWRFNQGSLNWSNVSRVKLLRDHDPTQPVGRAVALDDRRDGLYGVYQVARGDKGDEVLSLAEDGVLDGFSAGPLIEPGGWEVDPTERGVRSVFNGRLVETTITAIPAYDDARVHHVAAMLRMPTQIQEGPNGQDRRYNSASWRGWGG